MSDSPSLPLRLFQSFFAASTLLSEAWAARRSAQIRFLELQIEILRSRLPGNRIIVAPEHRQRLLTLGQPLHHRVSDLLHLVSFKTY